MPTPAEAIETYLRAKDGNRPHLLARAFAADATLEMVVHTSVISFPPLTQGREALARVVAGDFGRAYENVYTFCLCAPPPADANPFSCPWLVGLSAKADGGVRVGCGRYDWHFRPAAGGLVERLAITIEAMQALPAADLPAVADWLAALPWPWCPPARARAAMPGLAGLAPIAAWLDRAA